MKLKLEIIKWLKENKGEFITLHGLLIKFKIDLKDFNNLNKDKKFKEEVKNRIISNMLYWSSKDPRRVALIKFYLEAYDRQFFVEKGINFDDDGINIIIENISGIL